MEEEIEVVKPSSRAGRLHTAIHSLNEMCSDITDVIAKKDNMRIFTQRVKKKEAPGYFELITDPIDLAVIKGKSKRREYLTADLFVRDFTLMRENAEKYNGIDHKISEIARDFEQLGAEMIQKALDNEL